MLLVSVVKLFKLSKNLDGKFVFLYFSSFFFLFVAFFLTLKISDLFAFSYGDATYYHMGGESVYRTIASGGSLYEALFSYTWEPKYWGFIYLNYLSFDLYPDSAIFQSVILKVFNFLLWSIFLFHAINNIRGFSLSNNKMLYALILMSIFPIFLNYRDILVAVSFYFFCYFMFLKRNYVFVIMAIIVMYYFRREMIPLMLVGVMVSYFSRFVYDRIYRFGLILFSIVSLAICIVLVYLIGHDRFSLDALIKLPLSMIGTSPFQVISLYLDGESYYQGRVFNHLADVLFSFVWVYLFYSYVKLLVKKNIHELDSLLSVYFSIFVFIFNLVAYTLINDGFQARVKVSIMSLFVFMYLPKSKFSLVAALVSVTLFFLVAFRNLRWVL